MRNQRKKIIISVICGVFAAALMAFYAAAIHGNANELRNQTLEDYGGQQVEVFVATRNIAAGERLTSSNVERRTWLADLLPAGAMTDESLVMGATLAMPLLANEPVAQAKLQNGDNSLTVPEGYCAVSIPTNDVLAVGGDIHSGSVIAIYSADKDSVVLLASEVLVLDTSNGGSESYESSGLFGSSSSRQNLSWVTLCVPENMVEHIIAASRSTNLYLVLPGGE
jgi:pilus assembly protein CpaB